MPALRPSMSPLEATRGLFRSQPEGHGCGRWTDSRPAWRVHAPSSSRLTSNFDLVAPVEELREAQATSRAAGRRLGIVGGEAAALLFAFALLAAMTLRTDLAAARRRLAWYGARGWQLALVTVAESTVLALAGTVVGLAVGALGGALVANRAGAPVSEILSRSVFSAQGIALALLVVAAATGVLVRLSPRARPASPRARFSLVRCGGGRRRLAGDSRALARRRRGRSRPAPARARHLRGGSSRRTCCCDPHCGWPSAVAGPVARCSARVPFALAESGLRGRRDCVPRRQLRPRALRGELSRRRLHAASGTRLRTAFRSTTSSGRTCGG